MKKINTIGIIFTLIMIFFGCEEEKDPAGKRNIGVVPRITDLTGIFINGDPNSFISFKVNLESGTTVEQASVIVSTKNNFERVKIADLTSFPADVTLTLGAVNEKLGVISKGEVISIEVLTTRDGITTRSNAALFLIVYCEYDGALAVGNYHSVSPPTDWNSEGDISIQADPDDPYKVYVTGLEAIEGLNEDQGPLVMHIDPSTFKVTADKTVIASDAFGETNIAYEGTGSFNSCLGSYEMNFNISTDQTDYGTFAFTFTRN
jgi:hypothetical protein